MKDILIIIRRNFLSPTVIAILLLAAVMAFLKENRDALFISSVIVFNTLIAIVQEIRAQRMLKKLELMNAPRARRILPNGDTEEVMFDKLQVGDFVKLEMGDEIPADGLVTASSGLEADESIMTGESAPVDKAVDSTVYAASGVVAGSATMHVTAVGADTRVGKMASTLKRYNPRLTPIQKNIARAITWLTYGALGLAGLIFVVYWLSGENAVRIFKTITSGAVTVIPEGLLLASTLLLAYGSIRLAQAKVLPQKLAAIEAMALLDVLCVDKTGTLTSDKITFDNLELFDESVSNIRELIGIVAKETSSGSSTGDAMVAAFPAPERYEVIETLAFSSERKMSGIKVKFGGKIHNVLIGAPEFLGKLTELTPAQKRRVESLAGVGKRVLLVAMFDAEKGSLKQIPDQSGKSIGLVVLTNELRRGVEKTVAFLQNNGVSIRVISGDNPNTVQYVAKQVGIENPQNVITGAELNELHSHEWNKVVSETTIFARVLPEQKERLIATFKKMGNFTGMVGDGVNDALAIKKSDLGVAMFAGAASTRRVADIVLLSNSFNSLPLGMRLGNRIMQAIELIATLFFHKIIYGTVLLLSTLAYFIVYPYEPRHITFMNIFLVTLPTIMWTLFIPLPRHRLSSRYFWRDTLFAIIPIAALSGMVATMTYIMLRVIHPNDLQGVSTTTVIIAILFGIYLVFLVPRMFDVANDRKAKLARILYILVVVFIFTISFGIGFIRDFFDFTTPAWQGTLPLLLVIITTALLQWQIAGEAGKRLKQRER